MSKPLKPWRQCCVAIPDDGTVCWIRLYPWFSQPIQANYDGVNAVWQFQLSSDDGNTSYANIPFWQVFAWRNL
jgi:hypothetical protein